MGVVVYSNGITEDYKPGKLVFTEAELVTLFAEYDHIKTIRIPNLVNTWCIVGEGDNDPAEFNRIVSDIVQESVFSHALFIHDSEINPKWNATDSILYKGYNEFITMLKKTIDDVASNILDELSASEEYENRADLRPPLVTLGVTLDKRILFAYDPDEQSKEFYSNDDFYKFSQKVYDYICENQQNKEPFTIYADKKTVIIIESIKVKAFLTSMLEKFKSKEDYEICNHITEIMEDWTMVVKEPNSVKASKKSRQKKIDNSGEKPNGE